MSAIRGSLCSGYRTIWAPGVLEVATGTSTGRPASLEQLGPVVLGDVVLLAFFLVELEEVGRPVG